MKRLIWISVLGALTLANALHLRAQTATQGNLNTNPIPTAFHSPMVLETMFVAADRAMWGKKDWHTIPEYNALGKYTCDGLTLRGGIINKKTGAWPSGLLMKAKELAGGNLEISIMVWVFNPEHNHDKAVTLFFEILDGDRVVGTTTLGPLGVEDKGRPKGGSKKLVLPIEALKNDPRMKLRITMTTTDY